MARRRFWRGFAAGAAAGVGSTLGMFALAGVVGRARHPRIVRVEKTLQIGRPIQEVFDRWANLDRLSQWSSIIRSITTSGDRSHWIVDIGGKQLEWDAEIEQFIPNQAIGWKSLNGPKHTGRISFSPLGNDTLVSVTMNYAPPVPLLRPLIEEPVRNNVESYLDQVLRDFKASLEGKGQAEAGGAVRYSQAEPPRATGTFGAVPANPAQTQRAPMAEPANPVDFTRPPERKS